MGSIIHRVLCALLVITLALPGRALSQGFVPASLPDARDGWRQAIGEGIRQWEDLQRIHGVTEDDVFQYMLALLHSQGYSARALQNLRPVFHYDVDAYLDVPITILWTNTDPRSQAVQQATCWYMEPGEAPYCVDGDHVTMFGSRFLDLQDSWQAIVGRLVALEERLQVMLPLTSQPTGTFDGTCPAVACREIRRQQVSFGAIMGGSTAGSAMTGAFFTGAGGGLFAGLTVGGGAALQGVATAGTLKGSLDAAVGVFTVLGASAGIGIVVGGLAAVAIARASYIASGTVLGYPVGGATHRCGTCGETGTQYAGWVVDGSGLNCGPPSCLPDSPEPTPEDGDDDDGDCGTVTGYWDNGTEGGESPPSGEHELAGDTGLPSSGEEGACGVMVTMTGADCSSCESMAPEFMEPTTPEDCQDTGTCNWSCEECIEQGHSQLGEIVSCTGSVPQ